MPTFWDLFCGCGGMSIGFENKGFEGKFAVDWIEEIANTYAKNHPNTFVFNGDIRDVNFKKLERRFGKPDVVIGGPPCEGFTTASSSYESSGIRKPKRDLYFQAVRCVNEVDPKIILFENSAVAGGKYSAPILNAFKRINRDVRFHMLKAVDCGVPQIRRRSFLTDAIIEYPNLSEFSVVTPRKVFEGLPNVSNSKDPLHQLRVSTPEFTKRIKATDPGGFLYKNPTGGSRPWSFTNYRIHPDKPTMSVMLVGDFCHYKDARKLTFREYLRLMCIPDSYKFFYKNYGKMRVLAGSFLPPPTAEVWASEIKSKLKTVKKSDSQPVSKRELDLIQKGFHQECDVADSQVSFYLPLVFDAIQPNKLESMTNTELILTKSILNHNSCTAQRTIDNESNERSLVLDPVDQLDLIQIFGEGDFLEPVKDSLESSDQNSGNSDLIVKLIPIDKKAPDDKQIAFGVVLEPNEVDSQGDTIPEDEIEKAAHLWLARYQDRGFMHDKIVNSKVEIYESYIAPANLNINGQAVKKGTWLLMYHILDADMWKKIKSGEQTGFSMGGFARRVKV